MSCNTSMQHVNQLLVQRQEESSASSTFCIIFKKIFYLIIICATFNSFSDVYVLGTQIWQRPFKRYDLVFHTRLDFL